MNINMDPNLTLTNFANYKIKDFDKSLSKKWPIRDKRSHKVDPSNINFIKIPDYFILDASVTTPKAFQDL